MTRCGDSRSQVAATSDETESKKGGKALAHAPAAAMPAAKAEKAAKSSSSSSLKASKAASISGKQKSKAATQNDAQPQTTSKRGGAKGNGANSSDRSMQEEEAEDDFLDDFPPAPADSVVVRRGDVISPGDSIIALDVRKVSLTISDIL